MLYQSVPNFWTCEWEWRREYMLNKERERARPCDSPLERDQAHFWSVHTVRSMVSQWHRHPGSHARRQGMDPGAVRVRATAPSRQTPIEPCTAPLCSLTVFIWVFSYMFGWYKMDCFKVFTGPVIYCSPLCIYHSRFAQPTTLRQSEHAPPSPLALHTLTKFTKSVAFTQCEFTHGLDHTVCVCASVWQREWRAELWMNAQLWERFDSLKKSIDHYVVISVDIVALF